MRKYLDSYNGRIVWGKNKETIVGSWNGRIYEGSFKYPSKKKLEVLKAPKLSPGYKKVHSELESDIPYEDLVQGFYWVEYRGQMCITYFFGVIPFMGICLLYLDNFYSFEFITYPISIKIRECIWKAPGAGLSHNTIRTVPIKQGVYRCVDPYTKNVVFAYARGILPFLKVETWDIKRGVLNLNAIPLNLGWREVILGGELDEIIY